MIKIRNLKKSFKDKRVLDGIDLDIEKGKTTVIIGKSGCGKSVLIKHIIRLLEPDEGTIEFEGKDILKENEKDFNKTLMRFGMLFQGAALFDSMTVAGNVGFPLREHTKLSEEEIMKKVREKLKLVGLENTENMMPSDLSGGMKKRVGLARAIVMDPEIILFDEPTTGLDPVTSDSIGELMLNTQKELNTTYIAITHDIHLTYKIADKVAMLHNGKILEQGTVREIQDTKNVIVKDFLTGNSKGEINSASTLQEGA